MNKMKIYQGIVAAVSILAIGITKMSSLLYVMAVLIFLPSFFQKTDQKGRWKTAIEFGIACAGLFFILKYLF
ncbi:hypothetical protein [Bacillus massiliglaciei]|uniref:hypothetical protein n=1 Tax=Bacillus massiliglaciei TaxID=1816693 RepID=UPI000DA60A0C|nr:hypothetical protein [Bacillus massiliglaciei]